MVFPQQAFINFEDGSDALLRWLATAQATGFGSSGFRITSRAGAIVFVILSHGRLVPAAIGFGHVQTAEFLIYDHIFQLSLCFHLPLPNPEPLNPDPSQPE
jgi:hypothetical protein